MKTKNLILGTTLATLLATPAFADTMITIGTSNDTGVSGAGPFANLDVHLVSPTVATLTYTNDTGFVFGEVGAMVNATSFSASGLSFTLAPTSTKTPVYNFVMGGKLDGFGNFAVDEQPVPNGFSAAVDELMFTLTDNSGTWATSDAVLTGNPEAAVHAFTDTGMSFFAAGNPAGSPPPPPPPPPPPAVPEPSTGLLVLGSLGLFVFGLLAKGSISLV